MLTTLAFLVAACISITPPPAAPDAGAPTAAVSIEPTGAAASGSARTARPTRRPTARPTAPPTSTPRPATTVSPSPSASPGDVPATAVPLASDPREPSAAPSAASSPDPTAASASGAPAADPRASGAPSSGAPSSGAPGSPPLGPTRTPKPTVAAPSLTPGPPRERALAPVEVFGFLPSWELDRADTLDLDRLTTLAWFGVEAGARGQLLRETGSGATTSGWAGWTGEAFGALRQRAQDAGVRVVLTIQRFSWTSGQTRRTTRLLQDPAARGRLTREIVEAVTEARADGVNLDFEPLPEAVRDDFTQFVRELRAAMNAVDPTLQLTFDITVDITSYDIAALTAADAADAAFIMGYEYLTGSAARSGSNAPLDREGDFDLRGAVETALSLVPGDRLILGLPWYGRVWATVTDQPGSATRSGAGILGSSTVFYRDALSQAARTGRLYEPGEESAWTVYPARACETCRVTWRQLWYDDVDATRVKTEYALDQALRGVGFWALGYQGAGPEMWSVLDLAVGGDVDRRPPSGTAVLDPGVVRGERGGLPVVGRQIRLQLLADDGAAGSGVAFVRVSAGSEVDDDGQLREGTTFPYGGSVEVQTLTADPVYGLPTPRPNRGRATPAPSPTPPASPSAGPDASPGGSVEPAPPAAAASPLAPVPASPAASAPASGGPAPGPGASASPAASPLASPSPSRSPVPTAAPTPPSTPDLASGRRVIHVQFRDVAGNWSEPIAIPVFYRSGVQAAPTPTPVATASPTEPPVVPGESPSVDVVDDESPPPSAGGSPGGGPAP